MSQVTWNVLLIEVVDMKDRYRIFKNQKKRINAFIEALMGNYPGLHISFCVKDHNIAEFKIKGESVERKDMELVHQYLRGEICAPDKSRKYIPNKKPSREAWEEMPAEAQKELQSSSPSMPLTIDALEEHDLKTAKGPVELRQFACLPCYRSWWRTVLKTKPVSRCKGMNCGKERYDALPKDREFGIGRFICPNEDCKRTFYAHCEASSALVCRRCKTPSMPHVHPKWIKQARKRRSLNPNAKTFRPSSRPSYKEDIGPHFYPVSMYDGENLVHPLAGLSLGGSPLTTQPTEATPALAPPTTAASTASPPAGPTRQKRRIFNPSMPHISSGGTVSTFLSQCDFQKFGTEVILDHDDEVDDYAVGACNFDCLGCKNRYTVLCRMVDTAVCHRCNVINNPLHWAPPRDIEHRTDNQHSCSRCPQVGECPNILDARLAM